MTDTVIPKRLQVYSDEAVEKSRREEKELQDRQSSYIRSLPKFARYFRDHITGEQMTAAEKLLREIEITVKSGNATASYDGVSISAATFGSKTPTERTLEAFEHIRKCRQTLAEQLNTYDLWYYLSTALIEDLAPQELGNRIVVSGPLRLGEKRRRAIAINIIDTATCAILQVR